MNQVSRMGAGTTKPTAKLAKNQIKIIGGAIGNCVHVTEVHEFLRIADRLGYTTFSLGATVDTTTFVQAIEKNNADVIYISYSLTPDNLAGILEPFFAELSEKNLIRGKIFYFGGTPSCIEVAKKFNWFSHFFQGQEKHAEISETLFVKNRFPLQAHTEYDRHPAQSKNLTPDGIKRSVAESRSVPMIRHQFDLPSLGDTIDGVKKIAESGTVDILSLGPDPDTRDLVFEPERMNSALEGNRGDPVRTGEELRRIGNAAQCGNFPRLRTCAGTQNLMERAPADMSPINNAWGTVPLFWYSELDGRSGRPLQVAIQENLGMIRGYAERGIPVEINDSHQWSLRDTSDVIAVAAFYLAAYNAKKLGVKTYIAQFMFNTPRMTSAKMDLAKMLAKREMITRLEDESFVCVREVRAGPTHFSIDQDVAKGQLAASTLLALALKPQMIHVVSFCKADHAATADDVIESCKIVRGVIKTSLRDFPDFTLDKDVIARKNHLIREAGYLLNKIAEVFQSESPDPLSDPRILAKIVTCGFFDAPRLKNNPAALGTLCTMPVNGGIEAVDSRGVPISERDRIRSLLPLR
ncbi:MAG: hypothetical protein Q7T80_16935 [Methanoregula sp.]|nr:hypothetical protein [Methanoregula sp.]